MSQCCESDYECKIQKIKLAAFSRFGGEVIDYHQWRELFAGPDVRGAFGDLDKNESHWIFKHVGCFTRGCTWSPIDPFRWKLQWRKAGENICSTTEFHLDKDGEDTSESLDDVIKRRFAGMESSEEFLREDIAEKVVKKCLSEVKGTGIGKACGIW